MAYVERIDSVDINEKGEVYVRFTAGEEPLPARWQRETLVFDSMEAVARREQAVRQRITRGDLLVLQLVSALKADPDQGAVFNDLLTVSVKLSVDTVVSRG